MLKNLLDRYGPDPSNLTEVEQMRIALINMRLKEEDGDIRTAAPNSASSRAVANDNEKS